MNEKVLLPSRSLSLIIIDIMQYISNNNLTVYNDFISFIRNRDISYIIQINSFLNAVNILWKSIILILIGNIIISIFFITPLELFKILPEQKSLENIQHKYLLCIIIIPIIEEMLFRLPLRISKVNLVLFASIIIYVILYQYSFVLAITSFILIILCSLIFIKNIPNIPDSITNYYNKYFYFIFYLQAVVFGLLHLGNFNLDYKYIYLFPLFVIPYMYLGIVLGYIRVRFSNGILLSIAVHMFFNSIYFLFV